MKPSRAYRPAFTLQDICNFLDAMGATEISLHLGVIYFTFAGGDFVIGSMAEARKIVCPANFCMS
jgi:hypothetical protein